MDFSSKKVIFLGSSVTCGADGYSMCEVVRDALGCKALKWAVSGTTLADLDESYVVDPANFVSKGKNNPFGGYKLDGVVKYTIVDGDIKYQA